MTNMKVQGKNNVTVKPEEEIQPTPHSTNQEEREGR
jgi:hypothetical protein